MTSTLLFLCVSWCTLTAAWSANPAHAPYALEHADLHFESFIQTYGRNYADENEKQARFQIFKERLEEINNLNENSKHAVYGITQFSDLSHEEFTSRFTCLRNSPDSRSDQDSCRFYYDKDIDGNDAPPESFDWRKHGAVTPVKNQGSCESCYAFSAIGSIEGQYAIKHKELIRLSEQQIVDCDESNIACHSGWIDVAMRSGGGNSTLNQGPVSCRHCIDGHVDRSLIKLGGCVSEADYPYQGQRANCSLDGKKVKVQLSNCRSYNLTSQEKLMELLYHVGPVSIAIKADALMSYKNGIISDEECDSGDINHGVLLVGYGSANGMPFWIVKNSWGTVFGEDGYFRMQRGEGALSCGMLNEYMATPVVT